MTLTLLLFKDHWRRGYLGQFFAETIFSISLKAFGDMVLFENSIPLLLATKWQFSYSFSSGILLNQSPTALAKRIILFSPLLPFLLVHKSNLSILIFSFTLYQSPFTFRRMVTIKLNSKHFLRYRLLSLAIIFY